MDEDANTTERYGEVCTMSEKDKISSVFDLLDKWKLFPAYQLERRADIYFAYYLPQIFKMEQINEEITHERIIPEFPYKIITTKDGRILSNKVDYAVFCKDKLYMVELKTDMDSIRPSQETDLKEAATKSFSKLICDALKIQNCTTKKEYQNKYRMFTFSLFTILNDLYKVKIPECLLCMESLPVPVDWSEYMWQVNCVCQNLEKKKLDFQPTIIHIQPKIRNNSEGIIITLKDVREQLSRDEALKADILAIRFCQSLRAWAD